MIYFWKLNKWFIWEIQVFSIGEIEIFIYILEIEIFIYLWNWNFFHLKLKDLIHNINWRLDLFSEMKRLDSLQKLKASRKNWRLDFILNKKFILEMENCNILRHIMKGPTLWGYLLSKALRFRWYIKNSHKSHHKFVFETQNHIFYDCKYK